ncbi:MAG: hypothetical protein A3C90_03980 [Candidatus Magasanikbacteria bacterium RIFCSPHIGHO2_02_FULL_51_14]|uniref:DUF721 domain-containing protein n=1 Tax=Candidatus Magasanikbacteria bacterium RIFCSPHIGHO2_02_FULL_51_14 TaxID=1798683 RepID=A0A1F6MNY5_9BACT|nr:MAG: hypothetical protein A3C90_03980 [Candidatus Magasanikbacteria bacterium RIFCSPHIGHO2_02_FULL_51_14]
MKSQGTPAKQNEALRIVEIASQIFEEVFGKKDAIHAKPLFLKNRTLTVTCSSAAMAQEIRANQGKIVARINEKLGKTEVDRIRYLA